MKKRLCTISMMICIIMTVFVSTIVPIVATSAMDDIGIEKPYISKNFDIIADNSIITKTLKNEEEKRDIKSVGPIYQQQERRHQTPDEQRLINRILQSDKRVTEKQFQHGQPTLDNNMKTTYSHHRVTEKQPQRQDVHRIGTVSDNRINMSVPMSDSRTTISDNEIKTKTYIQTPTISGEITIPEEIISKPINTIYGTFYVANYIPNVNKPIIIIDNGRPITISGYSNVLVSDNQWQDNQQNNDQQNQQNQQNNDQQNQQNQQNNDQQNNNQNGGNIIECWTENCQLRYGEYMLQNNMWGIPSSETDANQGVYYYESGGRFGWEWNRPNPKTDEGYILPTYPEVVVGTIPGDAPSTSTMPNFPIKYKDIDSWTSDISFGYPKSPTGRYNFAYDIYWMEGGTKKLNVMIWVNGHHDEEPVGTVSDGTNEYIHYRRYAGSGQYWEWHAFELKNQGGSDFKVDIKKLLDNTFSSGTISGDWTVAGMELGSEVWDGSGRIEVNRYNIGLNGQTISLVQ